MVMNLQNCLTVYKYHGGQIDNNYNIYDVEKNQ